MKALVAILFACTALTAPAVTTNRYVIVVSVDGMGSEYVKPLLATGLVNELTAFKRFQAEGAGTLNARDDADYAITLPNHVTMMTGRGVAGPAGHNWSGNTNPAPDSTLAANKGSYVASGFDVAHDNGLRTGIWSGKAKFRLFQQSYSPTSGAADVTGPDNGRDKIDCDQVVDGIPAEDLTDDFTNRMTETPFHFVFLHYQDPDATGHESGWSTNPADAFAQTLKRVDTQIGRILEMAETVPALRGRTTVILTADHGGHGTTHGDTNDVLDYTIPFYVWGAGAKAGADLYVLNPASRASPGAASNPRYTGPQPVRNGEAANLALGLLGAGPVPGSTLNSNQNLRILAELAITRLGRTGSGGVVLGGNADIAGAYVTERGTTPSAGAWQPVQTDAVPAGPFTVTLPPETNRAAFFRLVLP